jgi:hypothetical protein
MHVLLAVFASSLLEPSLQLRPRAESRDGVWQYNHRARVALEGAGGVAGRVVLQDVRTWGEEANTLGDFSADGLDLHEAFVAMEQGAFRWRVGRQEVSVDEQRLVGAVDWAQQGRAFDGVRLDWSGDGALAMLLAARTAGQDLFLAQGVLQPGSFYLSLPVLLETAATQDGDGGRLTAGMYLRRDPGVLAWRVEAYAQRQIEGDDALGWLAAARCGHRFSELWSPTLWLDVASGASNGIAAFDTLYATNHKFYGLADQFLNLPLHLGGKGLIDAAVKNDATFGEWHAQLALHAFRTAAGGEDRGQEADLAVDRAIGEGLRLEFGGALLRDPAGRFRTWTFLQLGYSTNKL